MSNHEKLAAILGPAVAKVLAEGHQHHRACIHNLPPEEQVALRRRTVDEWIALHGALPQQITPDQWTTEPPYDQDALREALS